MLGKDLGELFAPFTAIADTHSLVELITQDSRRDNLHAVLADMLRQSGRRCAYVLTIDQKTSAILGDGRRRTMHTCSHASHATHALFLC